MFKRRLLDVLILLFLYIILVFFMKSYSNKHVEKEITRVRAAYEAELKEKGLLPQEPKRRPKKEIYIPDDITGQAGRANSTDMFLKSAQKDFGQKSTDGLEVVDYGAQVDDYQQRVDAIRQAEAQKLAAQQARQEELNRKMGRTTQPQQPRQNTQAAAKEDGTKINRLKTSTLGSGSSSRY